MEIPLGSRRTSAKYSTHMTAEEYREAVAKTQGVPLERVPLIDKEAELTKMRAQYEQVQKKIASLKAVLQRNPKTAADKYEELFDIGKFIVFYNDKLQILPGVQEFPDFTLLFERYLVGVEHTRLWNNEERAMFKTGQHYIDKAEEILKDLSHLSKTVNIYIDYNQTVIGDGNFNNRKFTKEQREQIPYIIAEFIRSELTGGDIPKPAFIIRADITRNEDSRVDLELGESYLTKFEISEHLLECIRKKEEKAVRYRNARNVNALWLLVVADDINSFSGFNFEIAPLPDIKTSNFDRIMIFEKFTGNIHYLYNKARN